MLPPNRRQLCECHRSSEGTLKPCRFQLCPHAYHRSPLTRIVAAEPSVDAVVMVQHGSDSIKSKTIKPAWGETVGFEAGGGILLLWHLLMLSLHPLLPCHSWLKQPIDLSILALRLRPTTTCCPQPLAPQPFLAQTTHKLNILALTPAPSAPVPPLFLADRPYRP